jgi:hypothetical protein
MGIWFPDLELSDLEAVAFQAPVNLFRGRRQIAGQVTVTDSRFILLPGRIDGLLGVERIEVNRDDIGAVTIEPPGTAVARKRGLSARLRPQVEVHLPDVTLAMTLRDPDGLATALQTTK